MIFSRILAKRRLGSSVQYRGLYLLVQVCVYAAYWLVNRTGLALMFRAEGSAAEAAGQFAEHEVARAVAPLLFAFADTDAAPTIQVRLGRAGNITPQVLNKEPPRLHIRFINMHL